MGHFANLQFLKLMRSTKYTRAPCLVVKIKTHDAAVEKGRNNVDAQGAGDVNNDSAAVAAARVSRAGRRMVGQGRNDSNGNAAAPPLREKNTTQ